MPGEASYESFRGPVPENYERYFVPAIGAPLAENLIEVAALRPRERVLDVACGTGVVTRLAAERVGDGGSVAGADPNPGMLAIARASVPPEARITWCETAAEAMPLADESFDVVLCQLGLQFFTDRPAAIGEMARVLAAGGRLACNVPGPTPELFAIMADELTRHVGPEVGAFVHRVFSLHDQGELRKLVEGAGLRDVDIRAAPRRLRLPPPQEFLWQYVHSTPMAEAVGALDEDLRRALEDQVCERWREHTVDGALELTVRVTTATARKHAP